MLSFLLFLCFCALCFILQTHIVLYVTLTKWVNHFHFLSKLTVHVPFPLSISVIKYYHTWGLISVVALICHSRVDSSIPLQMVPVGCH